MRERYREGDPSEVIRVRRPTDGSLVGELAVTPVGDLRRRVERARTVQEGWASLAVRDRLRRLRALLRAVGAQAAEIEETICAETGKPRLEAAMEVALAADHLWHCLRLARRFFRPRRAPTGWLFWKRAVVEREPLGVVGVITPWNFPFLLSMNATSTALVAGNAVILKPSELTPYSGLLAEDLARAAGLPEGLVQVVVGGAQVGEALVRSGVDKVVFTGGSQTGRRVQAVAAENLTPVVLELGGKDPAIVLEDADLKRAARAVVWGAFMNAGQSCIGIERVFVAEEVFDRFLRELLRLVKRLRLGSDPRADVGPMASPTQMMRVEEQLRDALAGGARLLSGGGRPDPVANLMEPAVVVDVDPDSALMTEETFGPVLPVIAVQDAEEAIRRSWESAYGLSASVWTKDVKRGLAIARRLPAGAVSINDALAHYAVPGLPFGGTRGSGFGRLGGEEGLRELTRTRSLLVDRLGLAREPWWFPYTRRSEAVLRALLAYRWKGVVPGLWVLLRAASGRPQPRKGRGRRV